MKYLLLAVIFVSISGFAKSPDLFLYSCSDGRLANCSDCSDKTVNGLKSFEVDKAKKRVLVLDIEFVFKDLPEYSDVVRLCGKKISLN